jgi:hypothetical protein
MPYYRVTWDGYVEGEYETPELAKQALLDCFDDDYVDQYGRQWQDLVSVENLDDKESPFPTGIEDEHFADLDIKEAHDVWHKG